MNMFMQMKHNKYLQFYKVKKKSWKLLNEIPYNFSFFLHKWRQLINRNGKIENNI